MQVENNQVVLTNEEKASLHDTYAILNRLLVLTGASDLKLTASLDDSIAAEDIKDATNLLISLQQNKGIEYQG